MRYYTRKPIRVKFWSQVEFADTDDECWVWNGSKSTHGYGQILVEGRTMMAHRLAYILEVGPIPDGLVLDHLCRRTDCVNPRHLEPVTDRVNVLRGIGVTAIRAAQTHCIRGHEFNVENTYYQGKDKAYRMCRACKRVRRREKQDALRADSSRI